MGVAERKQREKELLRNQIIDTATKMFIKKGFEYTSIRKIANAIEYSPATIYLYFENKDQLFASIQENAFGRFYNKLNEFNFIKDPLGRLRALATSYVAFAIENPGLYNLMFMLANPLNNLESKKDWKHGQDFFNIVKSLITACNEKNLIRKMAPDEGAMMFWSFVHGLSALYISQRLNFYGNKELLQEHIKAVTDKMLETLKPSYF